MRTLQDILGKDEDLLMFQTWASVFGFTNLRIYCDLPGEVLFLQLIATPVQGVDQYPAAFETMIIKHFNCEISLINEAAIKSIFKKHVLENSIPIKERAQIEKKFGDSLSSIQVKLYEMDSKKDFERRVKHAEEIIKSKSLSKFSEDSLCPENLQRYSATKEMLQKDFGVGVVTVYQLKNNMFYLIMGEYHNKGALSPTVGARFDNSQSFYQTIQDAFCRKRLGQMSFTGGEIDKANVFYSTNEKQGFARVTFLQHIKVDLSEDQFKEKYIKPMHTEAQLQRSVSQFFWRLDETVNPNKKESKFKFKTAEERAQAAKNASEKIKSAVFVLDKEITAKLEEMQKTTCNWNHVLQPLKFYETYGGRKYSELTGFYLMSIVDVLQQLKQEKIKDQDKDKPTVYIEHPDLPREEAWKKFFIFEDEIGVFVKIICDLTATKKNSPTTFKPVSISKKIDELPSPWVSQKITFDKFQQLETPAETEVIEFKV